MNPTKASKLEDLEALRTARARQAMLSVDAQVQEKLGNLRTFINQMGRTPTGKAELINRVEVFGVCEPLPGESQRRFYCRLRLWLDRDLHGARSDEPMSGDEPASYGSTSPQSRRAK